MTGDTLHINIDLIERCKMGDSTAQFILYRQYSKTMYNIAIRFLNNKMDAEDVLQESFISAFEKLPELSSNIAFGSWLKRIVINNCINHVKKEKIRFDDLIHHETVELADNEPDFIIDPVIVHDSIKDLPTGGRTILVLHALEGYKHREIAEMMGISESTSKSQYKRAIELLNKNLKQKIYAS